MRESKVSIISPNLGGAFWTGLMRARAGNGQLPFKAAADLFGLTRAEYKAVRQGLAKIGGTYGTGYTLEPVEAVEARKLTRGAGCGDEGCEREGCPDCDPDEILFGEENAEADGLDVFGPVQG
jgi:hypothetical protein